MNQTEPPVNPHPDDPHWAARKLNRRRQRPKWMAFLFLLLVIAVTVTWGVLGDLGLPRPPGWVALLVIVILFVIAFRSALTSEYGRPPSWRLFSFLLLMITLGLLLRSLKYHEFSPLLSASLISLNVLLLVVINRSKPRQLDDETKCKIVCPACQQEIPSGDAAKCPICGIALRLPGHAENLKPETNYVRRAKLHRIWICSSVLITVGIIALGYLIDPLFADKTWVDTAYTIWGVGFTISFLVTVVMGALLSQRKR